MIAGLEEMANLKIPKNITSDEGNKYLAATHVRDLRSSAHLFELQLVCWTNLWDTFWKKLAQTQHSSSIILKS
ncbi:hypothetical protein LINGRAHAP2_LOCUS7362 [Linum grandiflorum]